VPPDTGPPAAAVVVTAVVFAGAAVVVLAGADVVVLVSFSPQPLKINPLINIIDKAIKSSFFKFKIPP
jgi:hypothetical protein